MKEKRNQFAISEDEAIEAINEAVYMKLYNTEVDDNKLYKKVMQKWGKKEEICKTVSEIIFAGILYEGGGVSELEGEEIPEFEDEEILEDYITNILTLNNEDISKFGTVKFREMAIRVLNICFLIPLSY